jgi:hypothetical protein
MATGEATGEATMMDASCPPHHHLVPGWFSCQQWAELSPHIDRLISQPGGILLIAVDVEPDRRNYPTVAFGVFDAEERKALKSALQSCRRGREKSRQNARGDLGAEVEYGDSGR